MKAERIIWTRTTGGRRKIFYILYAVACVCYFVYRLFPSEAVIAHVSDRVAAAAPGYSLAIGSLKPAFPPAVQAKTVALAYAGQEILLIDEVRISLRLQAILGLDPLFFFEGNTCGGTFAGRTEAEGPDGAGGLRLWLTFAGIDLESIPRLRELTGHGISGSLGGRAALAPVLTAAQKVTAAIVVSDAVIDTPAPVMGVSRLRFDRVAADLAFDRGKPAALESTFDGPQLMGEIAGTIALKRPIGDSGLDLEGTVRPHAEFLAQVGGSPALPPVVRKTIGESGFRFRFSGTCDAPAVALAPGPPAKKL